PRSVATKRRAGPPLTAKLARASEVGGAVVGFEEDFTLAGVVRGADDALLLHALDERGRLVIADLQAALDVAGRALLVAQDNRDGLVVKISALRAERALVEHRTVLALFLFRGDGFEIIGRTLRFQMAHDLLDFGVRAERAVDATDASAARHVEHVALTEKLFG